MGGGVDGQDWTGGVAAIPIADPWRAFTGPLNPRVGVCEAVEGHPALRVERG